jgi:hypothetical protein
MAPQAESLREAQALSPVVQPGVRQKVSGEVQFRFTYLFG